jgi:hypothetical protein
MIFFPRNTSTMTEFGKERGWRKIPHTAFDA